MNKINLKSLMIGTDMMVPLVNGKYTRYINMDNAASTAPFKVVMEKVNEFACLYSSIHRGAGLKLYLST